MSPRIVSVILQALRIDATQLSDARAAEIAENVFVAQSVAAGIPAREALAHAA